MNDRVAIINTSMARHSTNTMPDQRAANSPRRLIVLGSTGSIGRNTLAVVEHLHAHTKLRFEVVGLAAGNNVETLAQQAQRFKVGALAIAGSCDDISLGRSVDAVFEGPDAALQLVEKVARPGDMIVGAMVGSAGLPAIIAGIERGCDIALANKETLVAAGAIVMPLAKKHGVKHLPVDSEHSAVFQCLLAGRSPDEVCRIVLTASGGPFRTWSRERLETATVEEALNHPTWNMGAKITIDSATLMNKALEVIEAHWLFGLSAEQIEVVIHPQSIVHSFVEFRDGSVLAQMSPPDMRAPIQYALTWPARVGGSSPTLDWSTLRELRFEQVDHARFPAIELAWRAVQAGGTAGAILNAANEVAVAAFLDRAIPFNRITGIVADVFESISPTPATSLEEIMMADAAARQAATRLLATPARVYG